MITETPAKTFSPAERSQMERRQLALGAWKEGQIDNAELILDSVLLETMTPRVAAACWISKAGFRIDLGDTAGSGVALEKATPFVDALDIETRGSFYFQRARVHKAAQDIDAALTDYGGAAACWDETGNSEKSGAAFLNLAELYLASGDLESAQQNIDQSIRLFQSAQSFYLPQAHDTQAKIFLAQNRPALALTSITTALDLVGDREDWRKEFLQTKRRVQFYLLELLEVRTLADCDRLKVLATEKALRESNGSLSAAGRILDATHHAVSYIVDKNKELEPFRVKRRVRHKTLIKR